MFLVSRRSFLQHSTTALAAASLAPLLNAAEETALPEKFEILPYLQNPAPDSITVCFLSENATDVEVVWTKGPGKSHTKIKATSTAIPKVTWKVWKTCITGLQPGTSYSYKVLYKIDGASRETAPYTFKTLDPKAEKTRAISFNDVHEHIPTFEALLKQFQPDDYDFSILLGDIWDNTSTQNNAHRIFSLFALLVRSLDASQKPMLFVRGNHDCRGSFAAYLSYLFDFPGNDPSAPMAEQTLFHDWRSGPVWFIANDTGEDGFKQAEVFHPYRKRQVSWLQKILAESPWSNAPWRISLAHIPLYLSSHHPDRASCSQDARDLWAPVLNKAKIDFTLHGHQHRVDRLEKGKTYNVKIKEGYPLPQSSETPIPYDTMIGGGPDLSGKGAGTVTFLEADAHNLLIRMVNTEGKEAARFALKK